MFVLARVTLILAMASAPWMLGSVPVRYQLAIAGLVFLSLVLWALGVLLTVLKIEGGLTRPIPITLTAIVAFAAVGSVQLLPALPEKPIQTTWSQQLAEVSKSDQKEGVRSVPSVVPSATRFQVARIIIFGAVLFLGSQLFVEPDQRNLLYGALALTGASLALFGMAQKLSWNGELFWSIPLRYGGQPFAAFVNRNNAGGFLNLCLAACLGGIVLNNSPQRSSQSILKTSFSIMAVIVACGVIAALSRGAIAAAVIAFVILLPRLSIALGKGFWMSVIATCCAIAVVTVYLGFQTEATKRMKTLDDIEGAMGIRITHWTDTAPAIADRPWLGSGLGTYRYANRPYQDHLAPGAFWNADNLYFEIAVEAGLVGVALVAFFVLLMLLDLRSLWQLGPDSDRTDVAVVAAFALVAVGLQQVTDYGLSLMSLGIVSAVFIGMTSAAATADVPMFQFDGFSRFKAVITALVLVAVVGLAGYEVSHVEAGASLRNQLPKHLDSPESLTEFQVTALIQQGEESLKHSPDDALLMQTIAELMIYRYRVGEYERRKESAFGDPWTQSNIEELYRLANLVPDEEDRQRIRDMPAVQSGLLPAFVHLKNAQKKSDWLKNLHYQLAMLSFLDKEADPAGLDWLKRGANLDANEPSRLVNAGRIAFLHHKPENQVFSLLCFQRALRLNPEIFDDVMKIVQIVMDDRDVAEKLLVTPEHFIAFAQQTEDAKTIAIIANKLNQALTNDELKRSPGEIAWMKAHVAILAKNLEEATQYLETAVTEHPLNVDWRLQLADLLMQNGDYTSAKEHLSFAHQIAPRRKDVEFKLKQSIRGDINSPPKSEDIEPEEDKTPLYPSVL